MNKGKIDHPFYSAVWHGKNFPVESNRHIWSEFRHWFLTVLKILCIHICQSQCKWKGRKGFKNCSSKLCSSISKSSFNYLQMLHLCESTKLNPWGKRSYLWQGKTRQNSPDLCSASRIWLILSTRSEEITMPTEAGTFPVRKLKGTGSI